IPNSVPASLADLRKPPTKAAAGRSHDRNRISRLHSSLVGPAELFGLPENPPHDVVADLAWLAAVEAERRHLAMGREDRAIHRFAKTDGAAGAVAGVPASLAAGPFANVKVLKHHRKARLENFRIGQPRVGHVGVNAVSAVKPFAGGCAGANRLIILV